MSARCGKTLRPRRPRRLVAALAATLAAATVSAAGGAAPLGVDLDAFDAGKRTVSLPNGEALAYLEAGSPRGRAHPWLPTMRATGLGHNPFWEDPRGVAQAIDAFLDTPP